MRALDNKTKKELFDILINKYKIKCEETKNEQIFMDENKIYYYKDTPIAFIKKDKVYPTLLLITKYDNDLNYIIVNNGAKDSILNGADVFRPGIVEFSEFKKGDIVIIASEDQKILAIGEALYDYNELNDMKKGKVAENIHYYGDNIFRYIKRL
ncbi:glutamate 5-kinase [Nanobdella aerobiophila]|uniref:Glutamate 5-kinase n=1 Tax=Nanobdella aerobiophila TaxID=2586965 RepID=A0A915SFD5_9ARCH|nr:DUF1947 domain-containing protein [Nanobdella aerobiophila]BBL45660.1 glutamate 5-kinase [Nanobdella aerobiophila]